MSQNKLKVQDYIEIILRRKWVLIFTFLVGMTIAVAFSYSIPLAYRSSTLILLEPQKIPTAYVSPTITSTVQERLATISQQILSRTNLETIILQFGLYKQEENEGPPLLNVLKQKLKSIANLDLEKMLSHFNYRKAAESIPIDVLVERMRRDIEVKVMGGECFLRILRCKRARNSHEGHQYPSLSFYRKKSEAQRAASRRYV
jgi:uncharacterized protein involved in exopolysaccharide biosynthesis